MPEVETNMISCCRSGCGVIWWITDAHDDRLRESHSVFYCPNGHGQSYFGKTKAEKLQEQLEREQNRTENLRIEVRRANERRAHQERRAASYKGKLTLAKRRAEEVRDDG